MEEYKATGYFNIDRFINAWLGRVTMGISPAALTLAHLDWLLHLAISPGKQFELAERFLRSALEYWHYVAESPVRAQCPPCEPAPDDKRFMSDEWRNWPFDLYCQAFLMIERWWQDATTQVPGVDHHHENVVSFVARQMLDTLAPSNFMLANPEILRTTTAQGGLNLVRGWQNFLEDRHRAVHGKRPVGTEKFNIGKDVAITPGKVVFRNRLIELIQYRPTTESVHVEPVLIIPAWIMKYYILDLSPHNSLVKFLVDRGHTVFMVSWKNPGPEDRDLGMYDYQFQGAMAAIDSISAIVPGSKIHAVGYCLGGTLLAITAATMARDNDDRLATMSLLAAQTDFTESGELMLFIDESQVNYLEDTMWSQGYLDTKQMAGAFQLLRSNDLIWSQIIQNYLMGERQPMTDLMAWNADATRMPFKMHSEYLRRLFLNNDLAEGRYEVNGRPIVVSNIRIPTFLVGTVKDHVSPWRSVYKFHFLSDAEEVTFVLTSGGHNAGIVSEPGHHGRSYQISTRKEGESYIDPQTWWEATPVHEGSWWPVWLEWLALRSNGQTQPPSMGATEKGLLPLYDAPGHYVLQE